MSDVYALVMAGGGGTRLWPLSRLDRPKQLLPLIGRRSLFQVSIDRLLPWLPADHILVAAPRDLVAMLREQSTDWPGLTFLDEPSPKGTAAVIGLAAKRLARVDPECLMVCVTADHYIPDAERLRHLWKVACQVAGSGSLVTLGIQPTRADTGYGYIERGESLGAIDGVEVYRAKAFKEKPALEVAEGYLRDGLHTWNSGMFVWQAARILEEIDRWMPELAAVLNRIGASLGTSGEAALIREAWPEIRTQTIDFGVMERSERVAVVAASDLGWADLGSWDRIYDLRQSDANRNVIDAEAALLADSRGVLILQEERGGGLKPRLIALLGVDDLVVVDSPDALLVCPRDRAPEVRRLVERMQTEGLGSYLVRET